MIRKEDHNPQIKRGGRGKEGLSGSWWAVGSSGEKRRGQEGLEKKRTKNGGNKIAQSGNTEGGRPGREQKMEATREKGRNGRCTQAARGNSRRRPLGHTRGVERGSRPRWDTRSRTNFDIVGKQKAGKEKGLVKKANAIQCPRRGRRGVL